MQIRVGYELAYEFTQPTPMILALNVHYSRTSDIVVPDHMHCVPSVPITGYPDGFGNWCNRILAPSGRVVLSANGIVRDTGRPDPSWNAGVQHQVHLLPQDVLVYLLGSRYCETDRLSDTAWRLFRDAPLGWARVKAVCDFVHQHIQFGYQYANATKSAWEVYNQPQGVCRDFAHLAVTFCRALNIPARYCTGYLGDIGIPPNDAPMDFAAWFEAYLGGEWHVFDPRNNVPRAGRILIARGRDAADVAIATTFGPSELKGFRVWTDEVN
jgi:transglutaminase-like putative cysteine protease